MLKKEIMITGIILLTLFVVLSGCLNNTDEGIHTEPWNSGTLTLQSIQYEEKYSSEIGNYMTVEMYIGVDYNVGIDNEFQPSSLITSKGQELGISFNWECNRNSHKYSGWNGVPMTKGDSPGSFVVYVYYNSDQVLSKLDTDEKITYMNYIVSSAYGSSEHSYKINEND